MKKKKPLFILGICLSAVLMVVFIFITIFKTGERELARFEPKHYIFLALLLIAEFLLCLCCSFLFRKIREANEKQ